MNTIYRISILVLSVAFLTACSAEELINEKPSNTEMLTSNSPWKFDNFKLAWVTKTEKDTLTNQEIENEISDSYKNLEFTFNTDGTGLTTIPNAEEEPITWTWFFNGNNKICFEGVCDADSFMDIKLSENSFSFDLIAGSPSNTEGENIIYQGRYVFK